MVARDLDEAPMCVCVLVGSWFCQKARQRVLVVVKLEECCCSMGLCVGLQILLLFGSEILTLEIATTSTSTTPLSSSSSSSVLEDESVGESDVVFSSLLALFRSSVFSTGLRIWRHRGDPA